MANTYTQLYIQFVFCVKRRENMIDNSFREELQKYITGIVQQKKHLLIAIYCMPDHAHILVGMRPHQSVSDLARDIKANASRWINERKIQPKKFEWQSGFGAFSYARWELDTIINYINKQPEHHKKKTFKEEYIGFLDKFKVEYRQEYLFEFLD